MRFLENQEKDIALRLIERALEIAKSSKCERSMCGSIVVSNGEIIEEGFNSPPLHLEAQKRCFKSKKELNEKITDKTCCVHAEQRAIIDALKKNPGKLVGSTIYFIRLNGRGAMEFAGKPYCTICSKMALDVGIKNFVLYHEKGIGVYNTDEYNLLSYSYQ